MVCVNLDQLPYVTSGVERFLLDPAGAAQGMLLTNGMQVHFAPHLGTRILAVIRPGNRVTVYGVIAPDSTMLDAVAVEAADGTRIVDNGP
jgi:hypothetical protein